MIGNLKLVAQEAVIDCEKYDDSFPRDAQLKDITHLTVVIDDYLLNHPAPVFSSQPSEQSPIKRCWLFACCLPLKENSDEYLKICDSTVKMPLLENICCTLSDLTQLEKIIIKVNLCYVTNVTESILSQLLKSLPSSIREIHLEDLDSQVHVSKEFLNALQTKYGERIVLKNKVFPLFYQSLS